jgi:hypothetical protein
MEPESKFQKFGSPFSLSPMDMSPPNSPMNLSPDEAPIEQKRNLSYLESLPYNVFFNIVSTGNIEGKDLIYYCNASPLINEKCNKAFNAEGKVIPEYLFYVLLQRMGINPGDKPRQKYVRIIKHENVYKGLVRKFEAMNSKNILSKQNPYSNLFNLLYGKIHGDNLGLVKYAFRKFPENEKLQYLKFLVDDFFQILDLLKRDPTQTSIDVWGLNHNPGRLAYLRNVLHRVIEEYGLPKFDWNSNYSYGDYDSIRTLITQEDLYNVNQIVTLIVKAVSRINKYNVQLLKERIQETWKETVNDFQKHVAEESQRIMEDIIFWNKFKLNLNRGIVDKWLVAEILKEDEDYIVTPNDIQTLKNSVQTDLDELFTATENYQEAIDNFPLLVDLTNDELSYLMFLHVRILERKIPAFEKFDPAVLIKYY